MNTQPKTLCERLKSESRTDHDSVDHLVMSVHPFANKNNYERFLQLQAVFHRVVDAVYGDQALNQRIPGLAALARYAMVQADLADVGAQEEYADRVVPKLSGDEAIGWLYCAEGSNLGAALLYKEVQKIHFDEHYGARHLSGHPDGRAKHWRRFVAQLNDLGLNEAAQARAVEGARSAFAFYKQLLREVYGLPTAA